MDTKTVEIKGTAMSKDKARVLIQRTDLAEYGFDCGEPIDIMFNDSAIVIIAREEGVRKVSRVHDKRADRTYQVLDIRFDNDQRAAMFKGAERLSVSIDPNYIVISAA